MPQALVVAGSSAAASSVELAVDGGPFLAVQGLNEWNYVFGPGSLANGPHTVSVRASDGVQSVFDSVQFSVGTPPAGSRTSTYASSVDGETLTTRVHVPAGYDPNASVPLFVYLHGAGG
ncbi:MAG: hypothetical protein AB8H80_21885 [Planctomycetota bacterium]